MFGGDQLAETPAIDPRSLSGRTIETNLAELLGQPDKYYMNLKFKVDRIDDNKAYTHFHAYSCAREHLFRIVRKRSQKVRVASDVETKDGWKLQVVSLVVLNRNTNLEIQKKVRKIMVSGIAERAGESDIDTFIRSITSGILQKDIRKLGNRVYPIRFSEIESIEVKKTGSLDSVGKADEPAEAGPLDADAKADEPAEVKVSESGKADGASEAGKASEVKVAPDNSADSAANSDDSATSTDSEKGAGK